VSKLDFTALTGLHRCLDLTPSWQREIILRQAAKIRNLQAERGQIRKGYLRKIAKLERQLKALKDPSQ
jgi:hypothetical protein